MKINKKILGFMGGDQDREQLKTGKFFYKYLDSLRWFAEKEHQCYTFCYPHNDYNGSMFYNHVYNPTSMAWKDRFLTKIGCKTACEKKIEKTEIIYCTNSIYNLDYLKKIKSDKKIVEVSHAMGYSNSYLNQRKKDFKEGVVDKVICYDKVSCETLKRLYYDAEVVEIENPYYSFYQKNRNIFNNFETKAVSPFKKVVLLSLGWGYAGEVDYLTGILKNGIYPEWIESILERHSDIYFIIRLHPIQNNSQKKIYKDQRESLCFLKEKYKNVCEVREASRNLYSILEITDLHLTMSSMTAYECEYFGIPTCFMCPTLLVGGVHEDYFEDLLKKGKSVKAGMNKNSVENFIVNETRSPCTTNVDVQFSV